MLYMNETVNKWADYKILELIVFFIYLVHTYIIINYICEQITEFQFCRACTGHTYREVSWLFSFIVTSNYKDSMYPRSFLCEEAKIKQRTPSKKELCEIGEEAIWESRFTSFFLLHMNYFMEKTIFYCLFI